MKIKNIYSILSVTLLLSCSVKNEENKEQTEPIADSVGQVETKTPELKVKDNSLTLDKSYFGYYVAMFKATKLNNEKNAKESNKITFSIDSSTAGKLYGHTIVAGNIRPFSGSLHKNDTIFSADVKEPGDNRYDGEFQFTFLPDSQKLSGTWKSYDRNLPVSERIYYAIKQEFTYNPDLSLKEIAATVYGTADENGSESITTMAGKINASKQLLKKADVEDMFKRDLEVMRNAIYARHGYSFKNRQMRDFFDSYVSWYMPVSVDVTKELTSLEKKNIALIKFYEKYAETYYDYFGR